MVPHADVAAFMEEMRAAGADWQFVHLGGAVHSFTNPVAQSPAMGIAYDRKADERSWEYLKVFLGEVLR